ncbi:MAG: DUF3093 domain-containing protein [Propionicimonas sp.]|uniref:DUF3093 domain-containing protein n=1 Tax=Propionicimonas sp. TaxID=1955623 RepID=UPI003D1100C3
MSYRERLGVPAGWWVTGLLVALSFVTAVGFYIGPLVAVVAGVVTAAAVVAALLYYGRVVVAVEDSGVRAGESLLEWPWVGEVSVHERSATRRRLGPDADHAAWLVVRGFVPGSVEITVDDPADPHPYWLVSSRRPAQFAAAIEASRPISLDGEAGQGPARLPQ